MKNIDISQYMDSRYPWLCAFLDGYWNEYFHDNFNNTSEAVAEFVNRLDHSARKEFILEIGKAIGDEFLRPYITQGEKAAELALAFARMDFYSEDLSEIYDLLS